MQTLFVLQRSTSNRVSHFWQHLSFSKGTKLSATLAGFLLAIIFACTPPILSMDPSPQVSRFKLDNGIRVIYLRQTVVDAFGIFAFLPLGLCQDGKEKTQWSHLLEHLTLNATGPIRDFRKVNGETGADYLRLDFMGKTEETAEGLKLMSSWLSNPSFSEKSLKVEVSRANSEVEPSSNRLFAHKWAAAAWNQVMLHGLKQVSIHGPIQKATLEKVINYRDRHLINTHKLLLVCTSNEPLASIKEKITEALKHIPVSKNNLPDQPDINIKTKTTEVNWDLPVTHYLRTYQAPPITDPQFPAFLIAQHLGQSMAHTLTGFKKYTGMVFTQLEIKTEKNRRLSISATVKPNQNIENVNQEFDKLLALMTQNLNAFQFSSVVQLIAQRLEKPYDLKSVLKFQSEANNAMLLAGNRAIQWGIIEFRYGEHRETILKNLKKLTAVKVKNILQKHLAAKEGHTLILKANK